MFSIRKRAIKSCPVVEKCLTFKSCFLLTIVFKRSNLHFFCHQSVTFRKEVKRYPFLSAVHHLTFITKIKSDHRNKLCVGNGAIFKGFFVLPFPFLCFFIPF